MHDPSATEPPVDDPNDTSSRPRRRRLAAVLVSDVEGFSRAMQADEEATLDLLAAHERVMDEQLDRHHGRKIKEVGDAYMVEFGSVVAAVACALDVQRRFAEHNRAADPKRQLRVRIGVHLAEAVVQDEDLLGHDVNVASRLEGQAPVGAVCVCEEVFTRVCGKVDLVVEGLSRVDPEHLVRWAWLINRLTTDRPLKILAWGGQSLYDLCTGYADLAHTSPFERLKRHHVGPWTRDEVATLVADCCGESASAEVVYRVTGGHPALVRELLAGASAEICRGDADGVRARALNSGHLRQLRGRVERDAAGMEELARMAGGDLRRHNEPGEERLRWLGIIAEDGASAWRWTAPVLKEWSVQVPALELRTCR